jgi:hypothetical protein
LIRIWPSRKNGICYAFGSVRINLEILETKVGKFLCREADTIESNSESGRRTDMHGGILVSARRNLRSQECSVSA